MNQHLLEPSALFEVRTCIAFVLLIFWEHTGPGHEAFQGQEVELLREFFAAMFVILFEQMFSSFFERSVWGLAQPTHLVVLEQCKLHESAEDLLLDIRHQVRIPGRHEIFE